MAMYVLLCIRVNDTVSCAPDQFSTGQLHPNVDSESGHNSDVYISDGSNSESDMALVDPVASTPILTLTHLKEQRCVPCHF